MKNRFTFFIAPFSKPEVLSVSDLAQPEQSHSIGQRLINTSELLGGMNANLILTLPSLWIDHVGVQRL